MICICGAGYVGLVTGLCLAHSKYNVLFYDENKSKMELLQKGVSPIYERGILRLLEEGITSSRVHFTTELEDAVTRADIIFVCVDTPTVTGTTDMTKFNSLVDGIYALSQSDKVMVIKSTVPIGTCEQLSRRLNSMSERGVSFHIASNPEFLSEGDAVNNFLFPDRIVIGANNPCVSHTIQQIYKSVVPADTPMVITNTTTSEMIKYVSNVFLCTKISFINEIAALAAKTGANISDIEYGVGLDHRIGSEHLKSGSGFGGSCLPKDLRAFITFGETLGLDLVLCKAAEQVNVHQIDTICNLMDAEGRDFKGSIIALWGITYKKDTSDVRYSPAASFVKKALKLGAMLSIYDPYGMPEFRRLYPEGETVRYAPNKYSALVGARILVIMVDWDEFKNVSFIKIRSVMDVPEIIDCSRLYLKRKRDIESLGIKYKYIGQASE